MVRRPVNQPYSPCYRWHSLDGGNPVLPFVITCPVQGVR